MYFGKCILGDEFLFVFPTPVEALTLLAMLTIQ